MGIARAIDCITFNDRAENKSGSHLALFLVLHGIPGSMILGLGWVSDGSFSIRCGAAAGPFRLYGGLLFSWCMDRTHGGQVCGDMVDTFGTISSRDFTHA
ncbi:MAG: hypothetical protein ACRERW_02905, partial [Pseudomonas sp.]